MAEKVIVQFDNLMRNESVDLEIPLEITADEFVHAIDSAMKLRINFSDPSQSYLSCENPTILIKGDKTLEELGLRDGSRVIYFR